MPVEQSGYSEKREFMRLFIDAPLSYQIHGDETWQKGVGKDLSATGMAFVINETVPDGTLIDVRLKPGTEITPALQATVKVLRVTPMIDGRFELSTIIDKILP